MHPDGTAHGGSAVLIRANIKHYEMQPICTAMFQATILVIEDHQSPLGVSAIYSPPKHKPNKEDYVKLFSTLGAKFIAGGDYNAKHTFWGSRTTSTKGRQMYLAVDSLNLKPVSSGEPTYWPTDRNKTPDLIDLFITKSVNIHNLECKTSLELSSDHSPVFLHLNSNITQTSPPCHLCNHKTDWDKFKRLVAGKINLNLPFSSDQDIEEGVEHFNNIVQLSACEATPINRNGKSGTDCPTSVRELLAEKRELRRSWQVNRYPSIKKKLNAHIKKLKQTLEEMRNAGVQRHLEKLDATASSNYSLWKATQKLKRPQLHQPPIRRLDGTWASSDAEKAKVFANHLESVFIPHPDEGSSKLDSVNATLSSVHQLDPPLKKCSYTEVKHAINKLKNHKAPGYDLITSTVLKQLPKVAITFLTYLFNAILQRTYVPKQWKVAQIIMILKPGKSENDVKSYRPISLLPITSKLLETLFLKRLMPILVERNLIPEHQFGFRKGHGTIEQVHRLVEKINTSFEKKEYCSAVFLDISQAFDRVWHQGLLTKMKTSLPTNFYLFLRAYLSKRFFLVKQGNEVTSLRAILAGVPQGSVLGPILYLLFTADLPLDRNVLTGTFADDTAVLATDICPTEASAKLQNSLKLISEWLKDWKIKANETKSVQVTFTTRKETCPPVTLNDIEVPQAEVTRYLGIHLDRRLTWRHHIFTKRKALGQILRSFHWMLNKKSQMSLESKLLLYKCVIKPIWTYGIQLWGTAAKSNIEILQRFQSKTLRQIVNAPWYVTNDIIHKDLMIKTVKEEINTNITTYATRLKVHPNHLAMNLMLNPTTFTRLKRRAPQDLMLQPA